MNSPSHLIHELCGHSVGGRSIAGVETCIDFPHWKLAVDIGRCPQWAVARPTLLFTHAHMDHMGGVAMHAASRAMQGMEPPTYILPTSLRDSFERLMEAWRILDGSELPYQLICIEPGQEHRLPNGLLLRPFHSEHRSLCQGYAIYKTKKQLKEEYKDLSQMELDRLRVEAGLEITHEMESCEVAITGDTRIEVVENVEAVRLARLLVLEVTGLDERMSVEKCTLGGHIHLDQLSDRAHLFENEALLLTHFSARYSSDQIRSALAAKLPSNLLARVTPLLDGF